MNTPTVKQLIADYVRRLDEVEDTIFNPESSERILADALREQQQLKIELDDLTTLITHSNN